MTDTVETDVPTQPLAEPVTVYDAVAFALQVTEAPEFVDRLVAGAQE